MCGIVGGIRCGDFKTAEVLNSLAHRGPDSSGYFFDDQLFLGHTRLAIQDLSDLGNQPFYSKDKNFVIVFNGEIYNHWDIRKDLLKDFEFISSSDTETVLNCYIKFGEKCLKYFNGIFAFSVYNKTTNELFIARDHFGIKPLYIYQDTKKFLFGSEIKTFLNFDIDNTLQHKSFVNYISNLWSPGKLTPFKHVKKLLPGTYMKFFTNEFKTVNEVNYYVDDLSGHYNKLNEDDTIEKLDILLTKAVKRQLLSDVPVGFFLSGGLDSTLLVAIAKKLYPDRRFPCFTIEVENTNEEGFVNDLDYAKKAAKFLDVDLTIVDGNFDIIKDFDKMIWHLDEPQADPAPLSVLNISRIAREKNIKVLIGGTAADDIFSGYRRHRALAIEPYIYFTPLIFKKIIKFFIELLPINIPLFRRLRKLVINIDKKQEDRLIGYFDWMNPNKVKKLFKADLRENLLSYDSHKFFKKILSKAKKDSSLLQKILHLEKKTFLVDHNLNYTDKMSMAVGVESRVPYLDIELVEFVKKINPSLKLKGKETKYILRKVAEKYLPKEIIYRPKSGFGAPVRKWINGEMSEMIEKRLSRENISNQGIFDYDAVRSLIYKNKQAKSDYSYNIWSILAISSWVDQFYKKKESNDLI